jgi:murein DD-endopeptidase MepM/ murein hydrolase activator NlpD
MAFSTSDGRIGQTGESGLVTFGLDRKADPELRISYQLSNGQDVTEVLAIAPRTDAYRVVEGFDCDKVEARSPEQKAQVERGWRVKAEAWARWGEGLALPQTWLRPSEGPASSPFGPTRKYIGVSVVTGKPCESESIHRGYDIAVGIGTPILAPAPGEVILADMELYYEGGAVFLDHGHGLVSLFMHMSEINVAVGDRVEAGEPLGLSGNTGRTTGPHLHWGVRWRDASRSDRDGDIFIDPALLLELSVVSAEP